MYMEINIIKVTIFIFFEPMNRSNAPGKKPSKQQT